MLRWLALLILATIILAISEAGFSTYVVLGIAFYAAYCATQSRRETRKIAELLESLKADFTSRIDHLEASLLQLREAKKAPTAVPSPTAVKTEVPVLQTAPQIARIPALARPTTKDGRVTDSPAGQSPKTVSEVVQSFAATPSQAPSFAQIGAEAAESAFGKFRDSIKSNLDFEVWLGTNWLSKLGIFILVLGIAFFL